MRGIVFFALGFGAVCGICATGMAWPWISLLMILAAVAIVLALKFRRRFAFLAPVAVICAGLILGGGWNLLYRAVYLTSVTALNGVTIDAELTITDYSRESSYGVTADAVVMLEGKPYQLRAYLNTEEYLKPGDRVQGQFRFKVTFYDDDVSYHSGKGVFLLAYQQEDITVTGCDSAPWWSIPARLRRQIQNTIDTAFTSDTAPLAKALLIGDASDLSYSDDTALKISGIRHVIAVSGLHVSIFYGAVSLLTMKKRYLTLIVGAPVLLLFAAVAGFTPSVVRACIMVMLMMAAMALKREYDPPSALVFAVIVMLLVNPLTITSVSFQLSVGAVAGIYLFSKPITQWLSRYLVRRKGILGKIGQGIASSIGISLGATLLTTPLCACYFGMVSLVAVVTNLLVIWVISFIFYGIMAACLLYLIWESGALFLAKAVGLLIRFVLLVAHDMSRVPMAAVYTGSGYIVAWLVFVYLLLGVYLLSRKKQPGVLICCALIGLFLSQIATFTEPFTDECRVSVLDVGQGQCIVLQCGTRTYLVDCGGDSDTRTADTAAHTLLSQGITRLDGIILTHYDRDHAGALANLLTRVDTDLLLMPGYDAGEGSDLAEMTAGLPVFVTEDLVISDENMKLTVFGPIFQDTDNENSLCVLFQTENCAILITGDRSGVGERSLLRHTDLPEVDLLIAGHHGSKYSTCTELLEQVRPEIVVISVGENYYGHPAEETLDRISTYTNQIYRTDLNGTVIFRR